MNSARLGFVRRRPLGTLRRVPNHTETFAVSRFGQQFDILRKMAEIAAKRGARLNGSVAPHPTDNEGANNLPAAGKVREMINAHAPR